jgi:hypothetical protein
MWLYKPRHAKKMTMIVTMGGHEEDAEFIMKSAVEKLRWMGGPEQKQLICLDIGMDDETKEVCQMICSRYPFVEICSVEQLTARVEQNLQIHKECIILNLLIKFVIALREEYAG